MSLEGLIKFSYEQGINIDSKNIIVLFVAERNVSIKYLVCKNY